MDILDKPVGSEGRVKIKVEGGKAIFTFEHVHVSGKASIVVEEDAKYFLDELKKQTPDWVDLLIDMGKAAIP